MKIDETHLIIKSSMQNGALKQGRCLVHRFRMRLHVYHVFPYSRASETCRPLSRLHSESAQVGNSSDGINFNRTPA